MHSPISLFFKNTVTLFSVPPKFCISIAFNFFWGDFSQEKLKTSYSKFFRDDKECYGIFEKCIFFTCTSPKMHLVWPPKFCLSIVFNFSWDGCNTQEKSKTNFMQFFIYLFFFGGGVGGGRGEQGVSWEMCKWRILFWGRHFFFIYHSIYSIIYFFYLLTGYWAMYVLQKSAQLTDQLEHIVTLVR